MPMPGQPQGPQGAPPQGAQPQPPQPQPPQGGQAPQPKPPGQGQISAQQAILMIHTGYDALGKVLAGAPPNALDPEDKQLFNSGVTSFQALVMKLGKPQGTPGSPGMQQPQQKPAKAAMPMPDHANSGAKASY